MDEEKPFWEGASALFDIPQLARAWMSLAPPAEGMVLRTTMGRRTVVRAGDIKVAGCWYPDPDAPPNWGVWLAWAVGRGFFGVLYESRIGFNFDFGQKLEDGIGNANQESFAAGLMRAVCLYHDDSHRLDELPPSVTAWWGAEQSGHTPVT